MVFELNSLGDDDNVSCRLFTFAFRGCKLAVGKCAVKDASFKRIHRLERDLSLQTHRLLSKPERKRGESFFAFFAVVFAVHDNFFEVALLLVQEGERKILKCVKRLSPVSDCHAAVVACYGDVKRAVLVFDGGARDKPHTLQRAVEELRHFVLRAVLNRDSHLCFGKESAFLKDFHIDFIF